MFEKEAEERTKQYMNKHTEKYNCENTKLETDNYNVGRETGYEEGFQDGAEFGYNKAMNEIGYRIESAYREGFAFGKDKVNEWHYVKDELPRKSDSTLCELMPVFVAVKVGYKISTYGTYWNLKLGKFECLDEVYAWCYTPEPPELPREADE